MRSHRLPIASTAIRLVRLVALPLFLLTLGISVSVVVLPLLSAAESHERGSRESSEELTWDSRAQQFRESHVESPRSSETLVYPPIAKIVQPQRESLRSLEGHCVTSEVLAPMTC